MSEKAQKMAERVADAILAHRNDVSGRHTDSPNLKNKEVVKLSDGGYRVKFWSNQGTLHDCWISAHVTSDDGVVTFNHCGDDGMKRLVQLIRNDL